MATRLSVSERNNGISQFLRDMGINVPKNSFQFTTPAKAKKKKNNQDEIVDVALFTEATYPFVRGGVSTVIHQIIEAHPHLTFGIVFIGWDVRDDLVSKYPKLPQIKWTRTLFLNDKNKKEVNNNSFLSSFMNDASHAKVSQELFKALNDLREVNSTKGFEKIYFDYLNPKTRKSSLMDVTNSHVFLEMLLSICDQKQMTLNDLFWLQKELIHIFSNLTELDYPKAKVYHSHTQGYAGFAASLAALQNQGSFFLTEHSLYMRDVKNALNDDFNSRKEKFAKKRVEVSAIDLKRKAWQAWFELLGKWTYHQASTISYLYPRIAMEANQIGAPENISTIIPNGINFKDFSHARTAQAERAELRFNNDHQMIISLVGRVVPVKGILDMIETAKIMKEKMTVPFKVELVGPTDEDMSYFKLCQDKVEKYELQNVVVFTGPQKVTEYLGKTDLIVLSSHSEALPMAALEGMASGLPVVSTAVGSVRDIIEKPIHGVDHGACGLVAEAQNPGDLADKIMQVLTNKDLYTQFSEVAQVRVQEGYNLSKVMNAYGNIYKTLSLDHNFGKAEFLQ